MLRKPIISSLAVASLLGVAAVSPTVLAADQAGPEAATQGSAEHESAIKDAWLHGKLESALLFNEHLNSFDIDTDVKNGVASLTGAVESDIDRDLAGAIAKSIEGVTSVENGLIVDKSKAAVAKDDDASKQRRGFKQSVVNATLTARIKSQLLMNGNTGGMDINVDSKQGVVTLSGVVNSDEERDLAVRLAGNTNGAKSVTDQLVVNPR